MRTYVTLEPQDKGWLLLVERWHSNLRKSFDSFEKREWVREKSDVASGGIEKISVRSVRARSVRILIIFLEYQRTKILYHSLVSLYTRLLRISFVLLTSIIKLYTQMLRNTKLALEHRYIFIDSTITRLRKITPQIRLELSQNFDRNWISNYSVRLKNLAVHFRYSITRSKFLWWVVWMLNRTVRPVF